MLAHLGHLSGASELPYLLEMVTTNPARALGLDAAGVRVGGPADLVVFDAPSAEDALRLLSAAVPGAARGADRGPHPAGTHHRHGGGPDP